MGIGEMQACLARLCVNEPFRKLFYVDPTAALDGYGLTREESDALREVDRNMLDLFANSLVGKRGKRVEQAYPLLFAHHGAAMWRCYSRFYQLYPARPSQPRYQDVVDFGMFLEETLPQVENVPAYATDLARYERLCYLTTIAGISSGGLDEFAHAEAEPARLMTVDAQPLLRPNVQVADFAYDVSDIETTLQRGHVPEETRFATGRCSIAFRPDTKGIRMFRINKPTKTVLGLCDGRRSVGQIVAETEAALGTTDLSDSILDAINRLLLSRVLTLDRVGAGAGVGTIPIHGGAVQVESM
jgi:hypothetical protein